MSCNRCGTCCLETEMPLSKKDIKLLLEKGYNIEFFSRLDDESYFLLRNINGHCVFFDEKNKKCIVYADRPAGCRFYPVIYDESKGIVVDKICPSKKNWSEHQKKSIGKKVIKLIKKIDSEAEQRSSS